MRTVSHVASCKSLFPRRVLQCRPSSRHGIWYLIATFPLTFLARCLYRHDAAASHKRSLWKAIDPSPHGFRFSAPGYRKKRKKQGFRPSISFLLYLPITSCSSENYGEGPYRVAISHIIHTPRPQALRFTFRTRRRVTELMNASPARLTKPRLSRKMFLVPSSKTLRA